MSSRSVSSAKVSGVHLKHIFWGTAVRARVTKILPRILKQRSSPHCRFSVAPGKARQYLRISSTLIFGHPSQVVSTESRLPSWRRSNRQDGTILLYFREKVAYGHSRDLSTAAGIRHADGDPFLSRHSGIHGSRQVSAGRRLQLGVAQVEGRGVDAQYRL